MNFVCENCNYSKKLTNDQKHKYLGNRIKCPKCEASTYLLETPEVHLQTKSELDSPEVQAPETEKGAKQLFANLFAGQSRMVIAAVCSVAVLVPLSWILFSSGSEQANSLRQPGRTIGSPEIELPNFSGLHTGLERTQDQMRSHLKEKEETEAPEIEMPDFSRLQAGLKSAQDQMRSNLKEKEETDAKLQAKLREEETARQLKADEQRRADDQRQKAQKKRDQQRAEQKRIAAEERSKKREQNLAIAEQQRAEEERLKKQDYEKKQIEEFEEQMRDLSDVEWPVRHNAARWLAQRGLTSNPQPIDKYVAQLISAFDSEKSLNVKGELANAISKTGKPARSAFKRLSDQHFGHNGSHPGGFKDKNWRTYVINAASADDLVYLIKDEPKFGYIGGYIKENANFKNAKVVRALVETLTAYELNDPNKHKDIRDEQGRFRKRLYPNKVKLALTLLSHIEESGPEVAPVLKDLLGNLNTKSKYDNDAIRNASKLINVATNTGLFNDSEIHEQILKFKDKLRSSIARAWGSFDDSDVAVSELIKMIAGSNKKELVVIIESLNSFGKKSKPALMPISDVWLKGKLVDPLRAGHQQTVKTLGDFFFQIGDESFTPLLLAVSNTDENVGERFGVLSTGKSGNHPIYVDVVIYTLAKKFKKAALPSIKTHLENENYKGGACLWTS